MDERGIARLVSVAIVHRLEIVGVHHQQGIRRRPPPLPGERRKHLLEPAPVRQPRHRIGVGAVLPVPFAPDVEPLALDQAAHDDRADDAGDRESRHDRGQDRPDDRRRQQEHVQRVERQHRAETRERPEADLALRPERPGPDRAQECRQNDACRPGRGAQPPDVEPVGDADGGGDQGGRPPRERGRDPHDDRARIEGQAVFEPDGLQHDQDRPQPGQEAVDRRSEMDSMHSALHGSEGDGEDRHHAEPVRQGDEGVIRVERHKPSRLSAFMLQMSLSFS